MRVSLVARFVSHPAIEFGSRRRSAHRPRLGLTRDGTVYHRPRPSALGHPTVRSLRPQTSRFRFAVVARVNRVPLRRAALPLGPPRAHRA